MTDELGTGRMTDELGTGHMTSELRTKNDRRESHSCKSMRIWGLQARLLFGYLR